MLSESWQLRINRLTAFLPGLVALVVTALMMRINGFGFWSQGRLVGVELVTVIVPGFVLSLWAAKETWPVRLAVAFVCGLPVQLFGWLLAVTTGLTALAWVVPMAVVAVGFWWARGSFRREFFEPRQQVGRWPSVWLAAMWLVVLGRFAAEWVRNPSGDDATYWYQDLYWHLAISASAMERVPIEDPQAIVESFSYHWLTNAHIGVLAKAAGIDLVSLSAVGWMPVVFAVTIGLAYGFAQYLVRSKWAGLFAATLVVFPAAFLLDASMGGGTTENFIVLSPSHMLAMPVLLAIVWLVVIVLREGVRRWKALLPSFVGLLLVVPGVKVSSLAVVLAGLLLALMCALVVNRRRRLTAGLTVLVGLLMIVALPVFGGGGGGSSLELFGSAKARPVFTASLEALSEFSEGKQVLLLVAFVFMIILTHVWALSGLSIFRFRDPVSWFLLGVIGSGIGVTMVLIHPGQSQLYFALAVQPIVATVAGAGLWRLLVLYSTLVGKLRAILDLVPWTIVSAVAGALALHSPRIAMVSFATLTWQLMVVASVVGATALGMALTGRRRTAAVLFVCLTVFSIGPSLRSAVDARSYANFSAMEVAEQLGTRSPSERDVTATEFEALEVLANQTPVDSVVATNVHCVEVVTSEYCDARAFWVAGLGQRRALLGGWGYTTETRALQRFEDRHHTHQKYADEGLFSLNEQVFASPNAQAVSRLKGLGVTHLFASSRASGVSPDVTKFCTPLFQEEGVLLCQLLDQ